jgi:hypothetical protein
MELGYLISNQNHDTSINMRKLSIKSLCLLIFIFPFLIWGIKVVDLGIPDFINEISVFIFIISYLVFAVVLLKKVWKLLAVKKNK